MTLPRPPISATTPIPNQPFSSPEVYYLEGNQGHLPLGPGLYIDPSTGSFTDIEPSPYIYCTPQFSHLPVTYPPYGCNTEVNTAGVTDFSYAWTYCNFTSFPCIDTSSGTNFSYTWGFNTYLANFPAVNTGLGGSFYRCWIHNHSLTSFPLLDTRSATSFSTAWDSCYSLENFPSNMFDNCLATDFGLAWTTCGLSSRSVDNILVSLDTAGQSNGIVNIHGGTSASPGAAGLAAKASLEAKGWTVTTN